MARGVVLQQSLDLTMVARRGENVHTDPSLLDVAGAMEALPESPLPLTPRPVAKMDT